MASWRDPLPDAHGRTFWGLLDEADRQALATAGTVRRLHPGRAALLPEFLLTTGWRRVLGRPPAVSYWYGDAVTGTALNGARLMGPAFNSARKLAKVPRLLVLVLVLAGFVWWNGTYCDAGRVAPRCAQPVSTWTLSVKSWFQTKDGKQSAKTAPKSKTKTTPRPHRTTARP